MVSIDKNNNNIYIENKRFDVCKWIALFCVNKEQKFFVSQSETIEDSLPLKLIRRRHFVELHKRRLFLPIVNQTKAFIEGDYSCASACVCALYEYLVDLVGFDDHTIVGHRRFIHRELILCSALRHVFQQAVSTYETSQMASQSGKVSLDNGVPVGPKSGANPSLSEKKVPPQKEGTLTTDKLMNLFSQFASLVVEVGASESEKDLEALTRVVTVIDQRLSNLEALVDKQAENLRKKELRKQEQDLQANARKHAVSIARSYGTPEYLIESYDSDAKGCCTAVHIRGGQILSPKGYNAVRQVNSTIL